MISRYIIKIEHLYLDLQFEKEIHVYIKILVYQIVWTNQRIYAKDYSIIEFKDGYVILHLNMQVFQLSC